jgi:hypothetical protein
LQRIRKISRVVVPAFLAVVILYLVNATVNQHFHTLSSGMVIEHAHPFKKPNTGSPFQEHQHTSSELLFLGQVSMSFFWLCLFTFFLIRLFCLYRVKNSRPVLTFQNPDLYFVKNYHAPPVSFY